MSTEAIHAPQTYTENSQDLPETENEILDAAMLLSAIDGPMAGFLKAGQGRSQEDEDEIQSIFDQFNLLLYMDGVKDVIATIDAIRTGEALTEDQKAIQDLLEDLLNKSNNGTRLETDDGTWGKVFQDDLHKQAARERFTVERFGNRNAIQSVRRALGLCTLRAIAIEVQDVQKKKK